MYPKDSPYIFLIKENLQVLPVQLAPPADKLGTKTSAAYALLGSDVKTTFDMRVNASDWNNPI